ncbi:hypothetical protein ACVMGC_001038 [Bradyrhizobium barranii subsp. barranii]|uniref:hypothetical protein n=1 Tax=Bradyrhizobium TaxID=374 RepID=UPI001BABFC46|nr:MULTISPECIES: hypothetical protein [Bradyrhizobium]MBR0879637.1 hypothetical protein [Bradyrhizobium liaoningense]MCP1778809.1 hypothetical protein [Bradyrhizobium japonicum]MCP1958193.1 hypothetical protein [Bradyrhizobium japonicum]
MPKLRLVTSKPSNPPDDLATVWLRAAVQWQVVALYAWAAGCQALAAWLARPLDHG